MIKQRDGQQRHYPRIGVLRKGAPQVEAVTRDGRDYMKAGDDLAYFRFTSDIDGAEEAFERAFGTEPVALEVYLPNDTHDTAFVAWYEHWAGNTLRHRCDGETTVVVLADDGTYDERAMPCPGNCDPMGRMDVILPDMLAAGFIGVVQVKTTSIIDCETIADGLLFYQDAMKIDSLRGIPFVLSREPKMLSAPGAGRRVTKESWLLQLRPQAIWVADYIAQNATLLGTGQPTGHPAPSMAQGEIGPVSIALCPSCSEQYNADELPAVCTVCDYRFAHLAELLPLDPVAIADTDTDWENLKRETASMVGEATVTRDNSQANAAPVKPLPPAAVAPTASTKTYPPADLRPSQRVTPPPAPANVDGTPKAAVAKLGRPMNPHTLAGALAKKATQYPNANGAAVANKTRKTKLILSFRRMIGDDDEMRHMVQYELMGELSLAKWTNAQAWAVLKWLDTGPPPDFVINAHSKEEMALIIEGIMAQPMIGE